ncbi:hypothetical protein [Nocardia seriolae]|nr:hypothetical protein [Nocardia seriolae]
MLSDSRWSPAPATPGIPLQPVIPTGTPTPGTASTPTPPSSAYAPPQATTPAFAH